jgi:hypothetical protein
MGLTLAVKAMSMGLKRRDPALDFVPDIALRQYQNSRYLGQRKIGPLYRR